MDNAFIGNVDVDKIYIENTLYWQKPSQHTVLSYLQSTGSQYMDTGIPGQSGLKVEISFIRQAVTAAGCIIGSRVSSSSRIYSIIHDSTTTLYSGYNNSSTTISSVLSVETLYTIIKDDNKTYLNGTLIATATAAIYNNSLNMFLFALNQAGTVTQQDKMKCLACKMWAPDGTPWRDYIPVIKDGVYCMYDKVTQTYNFGFGTFTGA